MDKYTKGILTVIAVGIIGLNIQMMNGSGFMSKAHAVGDDVQKVAICDEFGFKCATVTSNELWVKSF